MESSLEEEWKDKINRMSENIERAIDTLEPHIKNKLLEAQPNMDSLTLHELSSYWLAQAIYPMQAMNIPNGISGDALIRYYLEEKCEYRDLKAYDRMASVSLLEVIDRMSSRKGDFKILDIGCGSGKFLKEIVELRPDVISQGLTPIDYGIDDGIDFTFGIAEAMPDEWIDRFDLITCFETSMYFWNQEKAFDEVLRVAKPDARIIYGTGNFKSVGNESIIEKRLGLQDYRYVVPSGYARAGEVFTGAQGKAIGKFLDFYHSLESWLKEEKIDRHDKQFSIESRQVTAWCPTILNLQGLDN